MHAWNDANDGSADGGDPPPSVSVRTAPGDMATADDGGGLTMGNSMKRDFQRFPKEFPILLSIDGSAAGGGGTPPWPCHEVIAPRSTHIVTTDDGGGPYDG